MTPKRPSVDPVVTRPLKVALSPELRDLITRLRAQTGAPSDAALMRAALGSLGRALRLTVPGPQPTAACAYPDPDNRLDSVPVASQTIAPVVPIQAVSKPIAPHKPFVYSDDDEGRRRWPYADED